MPRPAGRRALHAALADRLPDVDDVDAARAEKTGRSLDRVSCLFGAVVGDNDGLILSHRQPLTLLRELTGERCARRAA